MTEVQVILDFACCSCDRSVSVTVKCAGTGLSSASRAVAAVNVPCPSCGSVSKLYFEPNGTIRAVAPYSGACHVPEPSMN